MAEELAKRVDSPISCSDVFPDLIEMWNKALDGWYPPTEVTRDRWKECKRGENCSIHERAFVGFAASFAGRYYMSYATSARNINFVDICARRLLEKVTALADATFFVQDFLEYNPSRESPRFIYCDPPYSHQGSGTSRRSYPHLPVFDHDKFWDKVRQVNSLGIPIVVSEYAAPDDFVAVFSRLQPLGFSYKYRRQGVEHLWVSKEGTLAKWEGQLQEALHLERITKARDENSPLPPKKMLARIECSPDIKSAVRDRVNQLKQEGHTKESYRTYLQRAILLAKETPTETLQETLLVMVRYRDRTDQIAGFVDPWVWNVLRTVAVRLQCSLRQAGLTAMEAMENARDASLVGVGLPDVEE